MYDIVGKRRWYFLFSALITIPGLIFIVLGGLKPTVDFTGGTVWQVRFADRPAPAEVQAALVQLNHPEATVTALSDGYLSIRTNPVDLLPPSTAAPIPSVVPSASAAASAGGSPSASPTATPSASATPVPSPVASGSPVPIPAGTPFDTLRTALVARFGAAETASATTVGPLIGADLIRSSAILIIVGELFILAYLWFRFGFRFGTAAIVALLHDVMVVVGTFAILGYFFGLEFDALFVTALLTIIGFSVHDTIVVFDRIRENRTPPRRGAVRRHRQPLDPADAGSLDQHQPDCHRDAHRAASTRPGDHPNLHPGAPHRRRLGNLLVHLQREPDPGRLVRVGRAPASTHLAPAGRSVRSADNGTGSRR